MLLRVFFCANGKRILLLVGGYDKQRDPSIKRQRAELEPGTMMWQNASAKEGGDMAKTYEEVMAPIREAWNEETQALVPAVEEHFDRAHRLSFELGEQLASHR